MEAQVAEAQHAHDSAAKSGGIATRPAAPHRVFAARCWTTAVSAAVRAIDVRVRHPSGSSRGDDADADRRGRCSRARRRRPATADSAA
jgi:hypothetical protein